MRSHRRSAIHRFVADEAASSGLTHAGVGDQRRCPSGNVDCRHGAGETDVPCFECLFEEER